MAMEITINFGISFQRPKSVFIYMCLYIYIYLFYIYLFIYSSYLFTFFTARGVNKDTWFPEWNQTRKKLIIDNSS